MGGIAKVCDERSIRARLWCGAHLWSSWRLDWGLEHLARGTGSTGALTLLVVAIAGVSWPKRALQFEAIPGWCRDVCVASLRTGGAPVAVILVATGLGHFLLVHLAVWSRSYRMYSSPVFASFLAPASVALGSFLRFSLSAS